MLAFSVEVKTIWRQCHTLLQLVCYSEPIWSKDLCKWRHSNGLLKHTEILADTSQNNSLSKTFRWLVKELKLYYSNEHFFGSHATCNIHNTQHSGGEQVADDNGVLVRRRQWETKLVAVYKLFMIADMKLNANESGKCSLLPSRTDFALPFKILSIKMYHTSL
jgi:hypothetical protein